MLVWLAVLVILSANASGRIFFDTKLGVDIAPAEFYLRLWHLWNPNEWFGTLQDQYIGYAFPMAPFYLIAKAVQIPVWFTERLWLSVLVAVGFGGMVRLATELKIGTERSRVVAGLAFALWPTFTIVIGSTSAGLLPGLLAPWAVLPLVRAVKGGPLVSAAARSGVAVLFMGGVNATSTLYPLMLPALFILTQARGRRLIALTGWWAAAVALATSWWVVPLLLQAKYSFNFLPYVEQSATTAATMSAATFLRGAGNWTAYLNLGQPWLSAGWVMVTTPIAIVASAITAGVGLLGISRRDIRYGGWLKLSLGIAALIALAGYPGSLGGAFHQPVDQLLDGVLAPLRSVYKVEPVAAAVLALGIAHALVLRARRPSIIGDPAPRMLWHLAAIPAIGLVLVGLAFPYLSGQVLNPGSFTSLPKYWYQVSAFIEQHSPRAPVLVAPAAAHGAYVWGETVEEPLEPLASSPWVEQGLVPYGGAGSQLLLSSLEGAIASGERTPGLAATLARSGIRYVVVRNDLNPAELGYTSPELMHQALTNSGFRRVAAFGPVISGAQTGSGTLTGYGLPSYRAVEVFEARSEVGQPVPPPTIALPVSQTVLVNGGPDALLQLTGQRLLGSAPAVLAGDKLVATPALWAVTDTLPRADHAFGGVDQTPSYTYTRTGTNPPDDPLGGAGGPPRQLMPVPAAGHQTVAILTGAASVTASSSGSWLAEMPQIDPVNVFDPNPSTYWAEASPITPVGQWIQITFSHPVALADSIGIRLLVEGSLRPVADRLTVSTDAGTVTSVVHRTGATQSLRVVPGRTRTLRITIAAARGGVPGGPGAGFRKVEIPGVTVTRYESPAEDPAGRLASEVAFSFHRQVPSPATLADVTSYPPMARMFLVQAPTSFRITGSAIAVPGRRLDGLLARLAPVSKKTLQVTASSTFGSLPSLAPSNLFKPGQQSSWIAGAGKPELSLRWHGLRKIRRMVILPVQGIGAAPETIKITTNGHGIRYASIGLDGLTEIVPPLVTDHMTISFPVVQYAPVIQSGTGQVVQLPVGLSKLSIPALNGLRATSPAASARFTVPCGGGPKVKIAGLWFDTSVSGTFGDLTQFLPVQVTLCTPGGQLNLARGHFRLLAGRSGPFTLTDVSMVSASGSASSASRQPGQERPVRILSWGAESRSVSIGHGAAAYLELHQNANPGWVASLDGRVLTPVQLDGWQQGFVVPAGAGGVISMTFQPAKFYHAWIILSAVGAIVLLLIAFSPRRRRRVHDQTDDLPATVNTPAAGVSAARRLPPSSWLVGMLALAVLMLIIGGPAVIAVPVLAYLAYRWPTRYGVLAFAAVIGSGLIAAVAAHPASAGSGAFSGPAQACALVALAAALVPGWQGEPHQPGRPWRGWFSERLRRR